MDNNQQNVNKKEPYLQAPKVIQNPGERYAASTRAFQGIPSLAYGNNGRVWAVWYGGVTPGEDNNNYVMLAVSEDNGHTWSDEILVIQHDDDDVREFDPEIWLDPNGKLWIFWAQHPFGNRFGSYSGVWAITADETEEINATWSKPKRLCDGVMMCKPLVLSSGEWALPVSFWHKREAGSAAMIVSKDQGQTWVQQGACDVPPEVRSHDEHMIVERLDGSLWMLVRTKYGIGESTSNDGGRTWSALKPSGIPHPASRFFIRRTASGNLLLVRHDPGEDGVANGEFKGVRSDLTAFLSQNDGHSWPHKLLLDERAGVSYPDGAQANDGTWYIAYDYQRKEAREILMAAFCEEDIIKNRQDSSSHRLRVVINKASS